MQHVISLCGEKGGCEIWLSQAVLLLLHKILLPSNTYSVFNFTNYTPMKRITLTLKSALAVALMCMMSLSVQAQSGWRTNAMKGTPQAAPAYASGTAGTVYVSHGRYNEQIYQGDGRS